MFFSGWMPHVRIVVVGILAYAVLIAIIRITGKRTLSQMNAFDFVVTVALGSTLATVLLNENIALSEGVLALAILILLQYVTAWASLRSGLILRLVKSEPQLIFHKGRLLEKALQRERVNRDEVLQALRNQGVLSFEQVEAVVLETNGSFSILKSSGAESAPTLENVRKE